MDRSRLWYLSKIGFLENVPADAADEFSAHIRHQNVSRGEIIQDPQSVRPELTFVKTGTVRLYTIDEEGRQFSYSLLGPGSTYGCLSTFSLGTENMYIEAVEPALICTIPEASYHQLARKYPVLTERILEILSERLRERGEMMEQLALRSVKDRLLHLLKMLFNHYGTYNENTVFQPIALPLTQQELAYMIGSSREAVSQTLHRLSEEGLVRFPKRRTIELHQSLLQEVPLPSYVQHLYTY
ncbi:Crp/Fnr family transcriptional regulator [Alkalicoccus urumqiensis]|nr:Crp/Fnr family transcriptional regulator [Alkalicoccus urumqiensis]